MKKLATVLVLCLVAMSVYAANTEVKIPEPTANEALYIGQWESGRDGITIAKGVTGLVMTIGSKSFIGSNEFITPAFVDDKGILHVFFVTEGQKNSVDSFGVITQDGMLIFSQPRFGPMKRK